MPEERAPLEAAEIAAQRIANLIAPRAPDGWGFMLFLYTRGRGGFMTYVSNLDRQDGIRVVAEWLEGLRARGYTDTDVAEACWCCGARGGLMEAEGAHRRLVICGKCALTLKCK